MIEEIKNFIDLFGGKFKIIEIFFWGILFFLICSKIPKRRSRVFFSLLFSIVLLLQLLSLYFTQTFISYRFFIHFNLRSVESIIGIYVLQIFLFTLFFFFVLSLLVSSNRVFSLFQEKTKKIVLIRFQNWLVVVTIIVFSAILFFRGAAVEDFKALFEVLDVDTESFKVELKKNNMQDYVTPDNIVSESGKNIIVLSLESFERSYLTEGKFEKLTPNLRRLKNEWTYMDMEESYGSDWTSGSLYTFMTGFPAFFGIHGNTIFQTSYHSEISSIVHVMNKANYSTTFLNANTDFAGVYEMLNVFGMKRIIDKKNFKSNVEESVFGIRDKDLFDIAKKEILKEKDSKKPFAYFISTTDTHFPDGIYDKRMEKYIPKRQSDLEFMVNSVDYMVGDFIEFLKKNDLLENTIVYIFPDHLKMGDSSIFENKNERSLYVMTNSKKNQDKNQDKIFQIDLPNIILDGANIKHNVRFFSDYIGSNVHDKKKYIKKNINEITALNSSGYLRYDGRLLKDVEENPDLFNKIKNDRMRFIAHAGGKIDDYTYTNSLEALNLSYENGFRVFELDIIKTSDNTFVAAHDWDHWKSITGYKGETPVSREVFLKQKIFDSFTPLDINAINRWFSEHKDAILVTDKINEPLIFSNLFVDKKRLMMELFDMKAVKEGINANILSSMPSDGVIKEMDEQDLLELKKIGVKHIAISRRLIYLNYELLEACLKLGIKPFAFHINAESGIDEEYVLKNEMKYFYGIYADEWYFDN